MISKQELDRLASALPDNPGVARVVAELRQAMERCAALTDGVRDVNREVERLKDEMTTWRRRHAQVEQRMSDAALQSEEQAAEHRRASDGYKSSEALLAAERTALADREKTIEAREREVVRAERLAEERLAEARRLEALLAEPGPPEGG